MAGVHIRQVEMELRGGALAAAAIPSVGEKDARRRP